MIYVELNIRDESFVEKMGKIILRSGLDVWIRVVILQRCVEDRYVVSGKQQEEEVIFFSRDYVRV